MASLIPSYSNPCMAQTKNSSTVYLVGSPNTAASALHVHIINIANISAPVIERSVSSVSSESTSWENYTAPWKYGAPKICITFLGTSPIFYDTLLISQVDMDTTWKSVYYPINGTIAKPGKINGTFFDSKRTFSNVGQAGDYVWTFALANIPDTRYGWVFSQWKMNVSSSGLPIAKLPIVDPLLAVGTYTVGPSAPAKGHFIVFDKLGAGLILPTISKDFGTSDAPWLIPLEEKPVDMSEITLTADAFHTNMGTGAYILDKAQDGTVSTYYIDPSISNTLHRIPTPKNAPRFSSGMAAAAAGSKIVLYSTNDSGVAQLHMLNTETNEWSGPDLVLTPPDYNPPSVQEPGDQGSTSINLGAIGGAVGGITLLAVIVLLLIRRRRRRNSQNNSGNDNISKNSSSNDNITNGKSHASHTIDDNDTRPTELDARSPEGEPLPRKHPQFPAGAPPGYGHAYGYNFGQDGDLAVPLAGPQVISPSLQRHGSPEGALLPGQHPQFPAGASLGCDHAYRYNFGHDGDLGMPLAGPQVILSKPQHYGSAIVPAQSDAYHDHISPNIDRSHQEMSHQPLLALGHGDKAEIDRNTDDIVGTAPHSFGDKAEIDSSNDFVFPGSSTPSLLPPVIPPQPTGYASYEKVPFPNVPE